MTIPPARPERSDRIKIHARDYILEICLPRLVASSEDQEGLKKQIIAEFNENLEKKKRKLAKDPDVDIEALLGQANLILDEALDILNLYLKGRRKNRA